MDTIGSVVALNRGYAARLEGPNRERPSDADVTAYRQVGNAVCALLTEAAADEPYPDMAFYLAAYDALYETAPNESVDDIAVRALDTLVQNPSRGNMRLSPEARAEHARLTQADYDLCQGMLNGNETAQTAFVEQYQNLVWKHANRAAQTLRSGVAGADDLFQEGMIYLRGRAKTYNPRRGTRFSTYATQYLTQTLYRRGALLEDPVRVPKHIRSIIENLRAANRDRYAAGLPALRMEEIAERFGLEPDAAADLRTGKNHPLTVGNIWLATLLTEHLGSVDRGFNEQMGGSPDNDYILDEKSRLESITGAKRPAPDVAALRRVITDSMPELLKLLPERWASFLTEFHGLGGKAPVPIETMAARRNLSVGQVESRIRSAEIRLLKVVLEQGYSHDDFGDYST